MGVGVVLLLLMMVSDELCCGELVWVLFGWLLKGGIVYVVFLFC